VEKLSSEIARKTMHDIWKLSICLPYQIVHTYWHWHRMEHRARLRLYGSYILLSVRERICGAQIAIVHGSRFIAVIDWVDARQENRKCHPSL